MGKITVKIIFRTAVMTAALLICMFAVSETQSYAAANAPGRISSVKADGSKYKKAVLTWTATECDGYEIDTSKDRNFKKNVKTVTCSASAVKRTISRLTPGKRYYFRIRAFKKNKKSSVYGRWSKRVTCVIHDHKYKRSRIKALTEDVKQYMYTCSCGSTYYKGISGSGRIFDGIIVRLPSCITGQVKKTPKSDIMNIPPSKTHILKKSGNGYICKRCGQALNYIKRTYKNKKTGKKKTVTFRAPKNTFVNTSISVSVKNSKGAIYRYRLYYQNSKYNYYKYPKYKDYLVMHGCSTLVLTSVLNATVPKYRNFTPDMVLEEVIRPVVGKNVFRANFSKPLEKQMPIGLKGISKVLTKNGVRNKYVYKYTKKSATKEITEHLASGNPVIFYQSNSVLTPTTHAMIMLGLDDNGRVITGDTVHRPASLWGKNNRLVKFNTTKSAKSTTVKNVCRYFNASTSSISKVADFYNGQKGNVAYVLVYKDK